MAKVSPSKVSVLVFLRSEAVQVARSVPSGTSLAGIRTTVRDIVMGFPKATIVFWHKIQIDIK